MAVCDHPHLLVFLHGSGDSGAGVRAWVQAARPGFAAACAAHGIRTAWPDAPARAYTLSGGARVPTWFDRQALHPQGPEDVPGVAESRAQVEAIVAAHRAQVGAGGNGKGKVAVVGFSQGGCLALHCAAASPGVDCVVCLSSFLPEDSSARKAANASGRPPVFMGHGGRDTMVPSAWGEATCAALQSDGAQVTWKVYPDADHELTGEICQDALGFVLESFGI